MKNVSGVFLQSLPTLEQNGRIVYLTGHYTYIGTVYNGNQRIFIDEFDKNIYIVELNHNELEIILNS
jgi:hypothetical protein